MCHPVKFWERVIEQRVKAECYNIGEPIWVHAGAIDDRDCTFASSTYRAISREEEKFAYSLYWFKKKLMIRYQEKYYGGH